MYGFNKNHSLTGLLYTGNTLNHNIYVVGPIVLPLGGLYTVGDRLR